jgi:hypothetical protein
MLSNTTDKRPMVKVRVVQLVTLPALVRKVVRINSWEMEGELPRRSAGNPDRGCRRLPGYSAQKG